MAANPTPGQRADHVLHSLTTRPMPGSHGYAEARDAIAAAIRAAELAQAERDARLCESYWYDAWNGKLKDASGFLSNTAGKAYSAAIRESIHEPDPVP